MGELLTLKPRITTGSYDTGSRRAAQSDQFHVRTSTVDDETQKGYMQTEDLYPAREMSPILSSAMALIGEGIDYLNESIRMLANEELILSDDAVQKFQVLLPELFMCRGLGDGFGAVISSLYHAVKNMNSLSLNKKQLEAIRKILRRIHTEPFITFDEAVEEIMLLESAGFEVDPSHFQYAADLLNG